MTDALGNDALQNYLEAGARRGFTGYESRYDALPGVVGPLTNLYQLRSQANAEEWPVAPEPLLDEPGAPLKVLPQATGGAPNGFEVRLHLHEIALIAISIFFSTWFLVRDIALSISQ